MIQQCYFCGEIFGEKPPLENKEITGGECDICHRLFKIWYEEWMAGNIKETATEFILKCRKTVAENKTERRL